MASNQMRISGVNSGFDTEAMIQQMMSAYQMKIDKQNQKLQKLQWQQEQYRDITSKLTGFKSKYFDILKRDTYLMSPSSFSKFKSTITTKSGKESGLKVTTDSKSTPGNHKIKVDQLATAATTKGGQVSAQNFKLDVDKAIADSKADDTGRYNFSLDVKVGNVAKTVEFSGADKDELLASLNTELADAFGTTSSGASFISASVNGKGEFAFKTSGNAMATVTERTGNFGMGKPAARVAIDPAAALTGVSSISVTIPNYYDKSPVTKNIKFDTVSSTFFDARDDDASVKAQYLELKKAAFLKKYDVGDAEVTEEMMDEQKFIYSSVDAAHDFNSQNLVSALNSAYGLEQGIQFNIDGSSMTAKYIMDGSAAEFTMTSTCDATFGLKKGSATSYLEESTKLSDMGIAQNKGSKKDYTLPSGFSLDIANAINKAVPGADGKYSFALDVKVGGVSKTIQFSGSDEDEIVSSLNSELSKEFGSNGLKTVKNANGTYGFKIESGDSLSITENVGKFGFGAMTDKVSFNPGEADDNAIGVHAITVTLNDADGKPRNVTFNFSGLKTASDFDPSDPSDTEFASLKEAAYRKANGLSDSDTVTADDLAGFAYSAVDAAADSNSQKIIDRFNNHFASDDITFEYADGYLSAKDASGNAVNFSVDSDDGKFGLPANSVSHTFATVPGSDEGYSMTINGKTIELGANATVSDLLTAVNKSGAGVTMTYSKLEGSFTLTANDKGNGGDIDIADDNTLAQALGLTSATRASHTEGKNAIITLDGVQIEHNDNTYELDGIKFDFADVDPTDGEEISVVVDKDYGDIKQTIKDFVKDYNQMIDDINDYTQTARPKDKNKNYYEPLTDEEKEEMSEKEIEKWEEAAKKGLLYHDSTVTTVMSKIRTAMYSAVELEDGRKFGLYNMGIKTSSDFNDRGKLKIDEDALDKAFEENPDAIVKLFTDSENGVMAKVNNAIDSATKDTGKVKGTLVRKAGLEKGTSAKDNAIYKEMERINKRIEQLQDRYDKKEEYWWTVFTNLEKMQAQFNSQQSYIQQFTANGGYLS